MSFFGKDEVVDLTKLKKLGLLKEPQQEQKPVPEYYDFSQQTPSPQPPEPPKPEPESPLTFFDNFASNISQTQQQTTNQTPSLQTPDNSELSIKLENLEYQLERLAEKLSLIESKILAFEEKVK